MFPGEHICAYAKNVTTWVVHGLWPSIRGRKDGPFNCNRSLPFDFDSIEWLLPRLLKYWPNLYTEKRLDSFWKGEWEKHGTCALGLPQIKSESDYFNFTLGLRDDYDFGPILASNSIVPDDNLQFEVDDLIDTVQSQLNVEPMLTCYVLNNIQYLSEMQICLSKTFELVECQSEPNELDRIVRANRVQRGKCQPGKPVIYPTIQYALSFKNRLF